MSECDRELCLLAGLSKGFPHHHPPKKGRRRKKRHQRLNKKLQVPVYIEIELYNK